MSVWIYKKKYERFWSSNMSHCVEGTWHTSMFWRKAEPSSSRTYQPSKTKVLCCFETLGYVQLTLTQHKTRIFNTNTLKTLNLACFLCNLFSNFCWCFVYVHYGPWSFSIGTCGTFNTGLSNISTTQLTIPYTAVPLILATAEWTDGGHILLSFSYGVTFWPWKWQWQHSPFSAVTVSW